LNNFLLFGFWTMVLEQAALTHDIERIFRSKKSEKTFQNDEGAKQHMAPSTSQAAWTFVRVALSNRSKRHPQFFYQHRSGGAGQKRGAAVQFQHISVASGLCHVRLTNPPDARD
jgi:hypothetical protein